MLFNSRSLGLTRAKPIINQYAVKDNFLRYLCLDFWSLLRSLLLVLLWCDNSYVYFYILLIAFQMRVDYSQHHHVRFDYFCLCSLRNQQADRPDEGIDQPIHQPKQRNYCRILGLEWDLSPSRDLIRVNRIFLESRTALEWLCAGLFPLRLFNFVQHLLCVDQFHLLDLCNLFFHRLSFLARLGPEHTQGLIFLFMLDNFSHEGSNGILHFLNFIVSHLHNQK